jgi:hypothetical protein
MQVSQFKKNSFRDIQTPFSHRIQALNDSGIYDMIDTSSIKTSLAPSLLNFKSNHASMNTSTIKKQIIMTSKPIKVKETYTGTTTPNEQFFSLRSKNSSIGSRMS